MIEYHKFGFRDFNRGQIKCHGPELENLHGITHACIKTFSPFWLPFFFFLEKKKHTSLVSILFSSLTERFYEFHARWLQCVTVRLLALLTFWELIWSCLKGRVAGTLARAFAHVHRHIYAAYTQTVLREDICTRTHTHEKCAEHAVTAARQCHM